MAHPTHRVSGVGSADGGVTSRALAVGREPGSWRPSAPGRRHLPQGRSLVRAPYTSKRRTPTSLTVAGAPVLLGVHWPTSSPGSRSMGRRSGFPARGARDRSTG
jgi:hypothetical protein